MGDVSYWSYRKILDNHKSSINYLELRIAYHDLDICQVAAISIPKLPTWKEQRIPAFWWSTKYHIPSRSLSQVITVHDVCLTTEGIMSKCDEAAVGNTGSKLSKCYQQRRALGNVWSHNLVYICLNSTNFISIQSNFISIFISAWSQRLTDQISHICNDMKRKVIFLINLLWSGGLLLSRGWDDQE